jgi:DNA-binding NtrC family response regulator
MDLFLTYDWPGNLDEFGTVMKRFALLDDDAVRNELRTKIEESKETASGGSESYAMSPHGNESSISGVERTIINEVLRNTHWDERRAAAELRVSAETLSQKMAEYRLTR